MVDHTFDDTEMTGYFLPRHSQQLLKQLSGHIRLLARLGQPGLADETQQSAPVPGMGEWTACLDQLAGQLDLVLQALSWPARRASQDAAGDAPQTVVGAAVGAGTRYAPPADEGQVVYGVSLAQIDTLNLLIAGIRAYGDAVSADDMADFAPGTLSMLGHTIFDRAIEVDRVLVQIQEQQMDKGARQRFAVEEPHAFYGVQTPGELERLPGAGPITASASLH